MLGNVKCQDLYRGFSAALLIGQKSMPLALRW